MVRGFCCPSSTNPFTFRRCSFLRRDGRTLGQLSLRLDAAHCVLTGLCVLDALTLALMAVSVEVAAFAASQAVALGRPV